MKQCFINTQTAVTDSSQRNSIYLYTYAAELYFTSSAWKASNESKRRKQQRQQKRKRVRKYFNVYFFG